MPEQPNITAGVLIGGKSSRMGTAKAMLPWKGSTLLESVVRTARQVADDCVLLGDAERLPDTLKAMPRLPDAYPGIGPIAGLHALLTHCPDTWCLLLSCDVPNVTIHTISTLVDHITPDTRVVAYVTPAISTKPADSNPRGAGARSVQGRANASFDRLEPCCTLYHSRILAEVDRTIAHQQCALRALIESVPHTKIPVDPDTQAALHNINFPQDYNDPA